MTSYSLKLYNRWSNFPVPEYARKESLDVFRAPSSRYMNIFGVFPYGDGQTSFVQNLVWYDSNPGIKILPPSTGLASTNVVHNNFKTTIKKSWIEFSWCLDNDEELDEFDTAIAVEVVLFTAGSSTSTSLSRLYDRILFFDKSHPVRFEIPDFVDIPCAKDKSIFIGVNFTPIALNEESQPVIQNGNFNVNSEMNVIIDEEYTSTVTP